MAEHRPVPRRLSAGVILVDAAGRVLLQHRDDDPKIMFPSHWGITGGAGKRGESPEETARREVTEETGLRLGDIEPFKAYYSSEVAPANGRRGAAKTIAEYEVYVYHAPCPSPAEELICGEGRELRFFAPDDLAGVPLAYNHSEILGDFFASPVYGVYLRGAPFGEDDSDRGRFDPIGHFRKALAGGEPWFEAMMQAIALWRRPDERVGDRQYRYLIGGEAFDWLLLAERILGEVRPNMVDDAAVERLLFVGEAPVQLDDERLRALIGASKHQAHLNYMYGVILEQALQYAVELEVSKERLSVSIDDEARYGRGSPDPLFERIYERPRAELLREFRSQAGLRHAPAISLEDLHEFMYWLFKYRVKHAEPARVASDARKALAQLSAIEEAARRAGRRGKRASASSSDRDIVREAG